MATCVICSLAENGEFASIEGAQGGTIKILRKNPTFAIIRLSAGGVEPAHHHTFGHEVVLMSGRIKLWDLSIEKELDLKTGDYLFTSAWNVHWVKSFEESELFIRWEGEMDTFRDEDLETAKQEIAKPEKIPKGATVPTGCSTAMESLKSSEEPRHMADAHSKDSVSHPILANLHASLLFFANFLAGVAPLSAVDTSSKRRRLTEDDVATMSASPDVAAVRAAVLESRRGVRLP
ncbi:hypothetical protein Scep_009536 [Stephania cephalantha]|uniref:Cupin type-2 domain-containing protein n=1 Tax=Stephania cephalantha TaxID=152367 RepID=A0AAP0PGA9_9MAGN